MGIKWNVLGFIHGIYSWDTLGHSDGTHLHGGMVNCQVRDLLTKFDQMGLIREV